MRATMLRSFPFLKILLSMRWIGGQGCFDLAFSTCLGRSALPLVTCCERSGKLAEETIAARFCLGALNVSALVEIAAANEARRVIRQSRALKEVAHVFGSGAGCYQALDGTPTILVAGFEIGLFL
jgi:hypothetical protein